jgi:hypothetical protein
VPSRSTSVPNFHVAPMVGHVREEGVSPHCQIPSPLGVRTRILAILIGNSNYHNAPPLSCATGDAKLMADFCRSIDAEVDLHLDLSEKQIRTVCRDASRKLERETLNVDTLILYYSGHGNDGVILGIDGGAVRLEDVAQFFNGNQLPDFVSKPKILVWDCCRGAHSNLATKGDEHFSPDSEIVHLFATTESHVSYGGLSNSLFTRALVETLQTCPDRDIYDIHRTTTAKLKHTASVASGGHFLVQLPELRGTLSQKVYIPLPSK